MSSSRKPNDLLSRYNATLTALSRRTTGTSLSALITSFLVLHEATAIIPLVGVFYTARSFGIGERFIEYVNANRRVSNSPDEGRSWMVETTDRWMREGEAWTERVGRRYRIWGYSDGIAPPVSNSSSSSSSDAGASTNTGIGAVIAGDVANALVAYCTTKALLPVRIAASLYFSPAFARKVVVPIARVFKRSK